MKLSDDFRHCLKKLDNVKNQALCKIRQLDNYTSKIRHCFKFHNKITHCTGFFFALVLVMDADPAVKMAQKTYNSKQHKYCVILLRLSSCFLLFFGGTKKFPPRNAIIHYISICYADFWVFKLYKNYTFTPSISVNRVTKTRATGELGELFSKMQKFPQPYISRCYAYFQGELLKLLILIFF